MVIAIQTSAASTGFTLKWSATLANSACPARLSTSAQMMSHRALQTALLFRSSPSLLLRCSLPSLTMPESGPRLCLSLLADLLTPEEPN